MSLAELIESLPEGQRKHLDPASPGPMRMMAARGMAPLPPREMVVVLVGLGVDADEKLAASAQKTLGGLPDKILGPAVDSGLPPAGLEGLARVLAQAETVRPEILEKIVLQRQTPDAAVAYISRMAPGNVAEIIAANQERCMRSRDIVDGLRHNANLLKSSKDRLFDFLVRAGVIFDDMPEFSESMGRLTPSEMQAAADLIDLPPDVMALVEDSPDDDAKADAVVEALESNDGGLEDEEVKKKMPMLQLIQSLSTAQKIALAIKGNKEARSILVREPNRLISGAAIKNPRTTEAEVVTAAGSKSVSDEVIRIIARSKDLIRAYSVKKALVNNPKTPLPTAMGLLPLLRANDVRDVAKSKNVPSAVSTQAKRLLQRKK